MTTQEPSVCCVCGSRTKDPGLGARDRASGHRFEVVRCAGCGLQFTSPRPSTAELESYYPPASAPGWVECQAQRWLRWWRARWCARGLTPGRALDVGCGSGGMLIALQRMGWDVVGLERTEASAEPARRLGLEVHTAGLTDSRLREATFDLAIVWHVLEHLPDPVAALHEIRNRLRPAGRLVVAVPNINSWQARLAGPAWHHLNVPRHLYHFDPQSLQLVLNHAGFQIEGVAHVDLAYDVRGWWVCLRHAASRHRGAVVKVLGLAPLALAASLAGVWPAASATIIVRATAKLENGSALTQCPGSYTVSQYPR